MLRVIRDIRQLSPQDRGAAIAIGNFDGLHRGHQAVIAAMKRHADAYGLPPAIMTFEPHPRCYFRPDAPCDRLMTIADKLARLAELGVERAYVLRFNPALAQLPAQRFIDEVLVGALNVRHVVTGADFIFGHQRGGDSALLASQSARFSYEAVAPVGEAAQKFSSSDVRAAIRDGDMPRAAAILGHPYRWERQVVHGDARGRTIGFPTANIVPPPVLLPRTGVYAVWVTHRGERMAGVANLGTKPTVAGTRMGLEVHLPDRKIHLYGERLCVEFHSFIRPEQRFAGVDALKQQITKDCQTAMAQLGLN